MTTFTVNTHHAYLNNKIVIQSESEEWITIERYQYWSKI